MRRGTAQVVRFVLCVVAALFLGYAGVRMTSLESVAGNTVAEEFYNGVGILSYGLAVLCIALGVPPGSRARRRPPTVGIRPVERVEAAPTPRVPVAGSIEATSPSAMPVQASSPGREGFAYEGSSEREVVDKFRRHSQWMREQGYVLVDKRWVDVVGKYELRAWYTRTGER